MRQALCAVGVMVFLLSGNMWGQQWGNWIAASNNFNIAYRFRLLKNGKSCDLEFKDQNQGDGYTTFDAAVDYQTPTSKFDNTMITKTDSEHIVTATKHNGNAQIPNCFGITEARVSFILRH
ncbi:MAG: hypothetical protein ACLP6G_06580 [Terriglobales bacterium]